MYQKHLHLLELLLEATQGGKVAWRRAGANEHATELSGYPCWIRFRPAPLGGVGRPGTDIVDVSVGEEALTFYNGSEGYDLVEQILVAAYPEILQQAQVTAVRLDAMLNRIESVFT